MTRTLQDYRPQHGEDCAVNECRTCGFSMGGNLDHEGPFYSDAHHPFKLQDCTCGLDALLAECAPAAPPEHICSCGTVMVCPDIGCDRNKAPAPPETMEPICICDRTAHPNDCPVHRDYQPAPETETPRSGVIRHPDNRGVSITKSAPSPSDVEQARRALKTYISQWCAAGITAEVSALVVHGGRGLSAWTEAAGRNVFSGRRTKP